MFYVYRQIPYVHRKNLPAEKGLLSSAESLGLTDRVEG